MKYLFDNKRKVTAKMIEQTMAYDTVNEEEYPITEEYKQEHMIEILKSSFESLQLDLKKWYNVDNVFALELSAPVLQRINNELEKYGI
jgi:hypothetical protein